MSPRSFWLGIFLLFSLLGTGQVRGNTLPENQRLILEGGHERIPLGRYLDIFEDRGGNMTFEEVVSLDASRFSPRQEVKSPNFGFTSSAFWARLQIENHASLENWLIEVNYPFIDSIDVYWVDGKGEIVHHKTGDSLPFSQREKKHHNFIFGFDLEKGKSVTAWFRFETKGSMRMPLVLWSPEAFDLKDHEEQLIFGLYYGMLFAMIVINLFFLAAIRDKIYLYFVLFIICYFHIQFTINGLAYEYLWSNHPWLYSALHPFFMSLAILVGFLLTGAFLSTKEQTPKIHRFINFFIWISLMVAILSFFLDYRYISKGCAFLAIIFTSTAMSTGVIAWRQGYKPARFFLLGWLFFLVGVFLYGTTTLGLLPDIFITNYGMQMGSALLIFFLSIALSDRVGSMQREKLHAQAEMLRAKDEFLKQLTQLNEANSRFVPFEFLEHLDKKSVLEVQLGDHAEREMCILFADIRSFTTLSEGMDLDENFRFINGYLGRVGPVIRKHDGFIDKYIGDAVMALFPDAESGLKAAIEMHQQVVEFNRDREKEGDAGIAIGVGLHTGKLMLGTIGEEKRMEGTVISDAVNLASRIEGLTKNYGAKILISSDAFETIEDKGLYQYRPLGTVKVKGKEEPVTIREILDVCSEEEITGKRRTLDTFTEGVTLLEKGDFAQAAVSFERVLQSDPTDVAAGYYRDKCCSQC